VTANRSPASSSAPSETRQKSFTTGQHILLPIILAAAGVIAISYFFPWTRWFWERRERLAMDETHLASRRTPPREDVIVLGVDDKSLKLDGLWPEEIEASPALQAMQKQWTWPRRVWAHVLDRLFEAGAKQVFLDITFKGPSEIAENDKILKEALHRHRGKVVLGIKVENSEDRGGPRTELMIPTPEITGGDISTDEFGLLNFWGDDDGKIRTATWQTTLSEVANDFAVEVAQRENPYATIEPIAIDNPDDRILNSVSFRLALGINPKFQVPPASTSTIRFGPEEAYPAISIHELFLPGTWESNLANGAVFRDKTVLVGATATDLQDFQTTTIGVIPGVNVHAHALAALMAGAFINQAPPWYRWVAIGSAAFAAWLILSFVRMPVISVSLILALYFASQWLAKNAFDWFDLEISSFPFSLALGACSVAGLTGTFVMQLRESRKLQRFLARYTSAEFAQEMMSDRASLYTTLGGVKRTVTIFFSDVRGFTSMSENMSPTEIVAQLNEYLSPMVERVITHKGIVDKFIGDAVMALWGSTRAQSTEATCKQDAIDAVNASLAMRSVLDVLNAGWGNRGMAELKVGMGIHQGEVVVGNIGSESPYEKMDLTVIGDGVNLASRLEGVTKEYGVDLIISDAVHRHVKDDFLCRSADLVAVKGKAKPVAVFTVLGPASESPPAGLEAFETGMRLYREGRFDAAQAAFLDCAEAGLDDTLTHVYLDRCQVLRDHPPEVWDGVFKMTRK
jgi:adenylate cyclase